MYTPGVGNMTEAALGPIFGKLQQFGPVKRALERSPSLIQSLLTGTQSAGQTAAEVYERGGDPTTAALAGGGLGLGLGAVAGKTHGMVKNLPSPTGQRIQNTLTGYAPLPPNTLQLSDSATNFLQDASTAFEKLGEAEKAGELVGKNAAVATAMNKAAAKKQTTVLAQDTIAAGKAAEVAKAQTRAKFLATDDVNDAFDYLRLDHPQVAAQAKEAVESAQIAVDQLQNTPPNVHHFAWYKTRKKTAEDTLVAAKKQQIDAEQDRLAALDMTRRTERAGRVAAGQNVATDIAATSDAAKAARKAELTVERHRQELKAINSAGATAQTRQQVEAASQGYFSAQMEKILAGHGMKSTDISPNGWRFLANIDPKKNTLSQSLAIASRDRELAEGFHDLLLAKDPDMLRAVRGQFLYDLFEGTRRGEGGANFARPFSGKELLAKFQGENKMDPNAINTLFNDKEAFSTIKALAEAADKADELAKPRARMTAGHLALTGAGTVLFAGAGQLTTDPMKAAALIALAGGGYAVLNIPRFAEAYATRTAARTRNDSTGSTAC
jgi:chemotaxis protein histidine kinase CheA